MLWLIGCNGMLGTELAKKLNEDGPKNIANLARQIGAKVIHISTDYVFDGTGSSPYSEDMPIAPIGVYGKTKAAGEEALGQNLDEYYILRTAWLYGWAGKNFVYTMIRAMNSRDSVKVVNDQKGTPTFAGDLASIIIKIIQKGNVPYGTYHCTDLGETTWWDFTNEIKKQGIEAGLVTNKDCVVNPCTTAEYPTPARRPAYSVLSKDKIQKALGISLPHWQESLRVFLQSPLFNCK
ncbi:MAG: dTDP-4-dehydrorhamnose reductase [Treponema sp.]|nr:dTDP-4-dehydrorhamnose reductase [Treponema sp.]